MDKHDSLLQVCDNRDEAESLLPKYADWLTARRMVKRYGVVAKPLVKNRPTGPWGIILHDRQDA